MHVEGPWTMTRRSTNPVTGKMEIQPIETFILEEDWGIKKRFFDFWATQADRDVPQGEFLDARCPSNTSKDQPCQVTYTVSGTTHIGSFDGNVITWPSRPGVQHIHEDALHHNCTCPPVGPVIQPWVEGQPWVLRWQLSTENTLKKLKLLHFTYYISNMKKLRKEIQIAKSKTKIAKSETKFSCTNCILEVELYEKEIISSVVI